MATPQAFLPEMAHDVIESPTFLLATRIIDTVCTCLILVLLIIHSHTIITSAASPSNKLERQKSVTLSRDSFKKWNKILSVSTISFILTQFLLLTILTVNIWSIVPTTIDCNIVVNVVTTLYHLSKSWYYFILITRLQVAFKLSSLAYKKITIRSLLVFVVVYTLTVCIGTPLIIYGKWLYSPINWCHIHILPTFWSSIAIALWMVLDVLISVALSYMFIRPLKSIVRDSMNHHITREYTKVYVKYTILSNISIVLNLVSLSLYLFKHLTVLIEITAAINCVCIFLMHVRYQRAFDFCCACVMKPCVPRAIHKHSMGEFSTQQSMRTGSRAASVSSPASSPDIEMPEVTSS